MLKLVIRGRTTHPLTWLSSELTTPRVVKDTEKLPSSDGAGGQGTATWAVS